MSALLSPLNGSGMAFRKNRSGVFRMAFTIVAGLRES